MAEVRTSERRLDGVGSSYDRHTRATEPRRAALRHALTPALGTHGWPTRPAAHSRRMFATHGALSDHPSTCGAAEVGLLQFPALPSGDVRRLARRHEARAMR